MRAICVDDELIPLRMLKKMVEESDNISSCVAFEDETEALEWAESNRVDLAFLDIELHAVSGLELAQRLRQIHPQISIVFCSSHEKYAVEAMNMHIDAGYLIKPFRPEQVQDEINYAINKRRKSRKLKVKCFGDFEVYTENGILEFKRKKTKELLAYLVDRRGSSVNTSQLLAVLWEDDSLDDKKRDTLYHLVSDLRRALEDNGYEEVFVSHNNGYSVNTQMMDCDFYNMLEGDKQAERQYMGDYMNQYSWAEHTNSWLDRKIFN